MSVADHLKRRRRIRQLGDLLQRERDIYLAPHKEIFDAFDRLQSRPIDDADYLNEIAATKDILARNGVSVPDLQGIVMETEDETLALECLMGMMMSGDAMCLQAARENNLQFDMGEAIECARQRALRQWRESVREQARQTLEARLGDIGMTLADLRGWRYLNAARGCKDGYLRSVIPELERIDEQPAGEPPSRDGLSEPRRMAKGRRPKGTVHQRMLEMITARPDAMAWSVTEWTKELRCSRAAVHDAPTWGMLEEHRQKTRIERGSDRRRRPRKQ